jgi:hypothetical protein
VWFIVLLPFGIWVGYQAAWRRSEPSVRAFEQLSRDLDRVFSLPKQERPAELLEALERANEASPDLIEFLERMENPNGAKFAAMLRTVRDTPDREAVLKWLTFSMDQETFWREEVERYFDSKN